MQLKFNLIICTYNRGPAIERLLKSVEKQFLYPNEILVVDSSSNEKTERLLSNLELPSLKYFKVGKENSGLTRQRNYGISKSGSSVEVVCFLDDDIVLEPDYFEKLISTYRKYPDAVAVGGWIRDETNWKSVPENYVPCYDEFKIDGFVRKLGKRNVIRKRLGLLPDTGPGVMPEFSHGFSTGFLPPSGKTYAVEYFMGGVSSYRKELFDQIKFCPHFEGYGLYEDMEFCLRASRIGQLYVNTAARVEHLHEESGRPDAFKYGRMVSENGYYVWKVKYPKSSFSSRVKYFSIDVLLMSLRFINGFHKDSSGIRDAGGRLKGLFEILIKKGTLR